MRVIMSFSSTSSEWFDLAAIAARPASSDGLRRTFDVGREEVAPLRRGKKAHRGRNSDKSSERCGTQNSHGAGHALDGDTVLACGRAHARQQRHGNAQQHEKNDQRQEEGLLRVHAWSRVVMCLRSPCIAAHRQACGQPNGSRAVATD